MPRQITRDDYNTDDLAKAVGAAIKEIALDKGLEAKDLAPKIGAKSVQTVYDYYSGKRQPSLGAILPLADALGVTPQSLAEKINENFKQYA